MIGGYYDPTTGQFHTVDPDVATTTEPYAYAGDDPVNDTDPSGDCGPQDNDDCASGQVTISRSANTLGYFSDETYSVAIATPVISVFLQSDVYSDNGLAFTTCTSDDEAQCLTGWIPRDGTASYLGLYQLTGVHLAGTPGHVNTFGFQIFATEESTYSGPPMQGRGEPLEPASGYGEDGSDSDPGPESAPESWVSPEEEAVSYEDGLGCSGAALDASEQPDPELQWSPYGVLNSAYDVHIEWYGPRADEAPALNEVSD